jgi:hypothetical protein
MALTQVETSGLSGSGASSNSTTGNVFSQTGPFKNKIINGGMAVDQRNTGASQTFTAGAALAYAVDRWYGYCTGANVTGQRVAGTGADQYRYRFTGASSVTAIGFAQRIEQLNSYDLNTTTATLSVDLANSLLTSVTWTAFYANTADTFGTLASPTRTQIATGTFTVTSTVTRYSASISIPAAATTGIEIVFTVGAQTSGTWTIGDVQLEAGSSATAFERRSFGQELALCQRYFEKWSYGSGSAGYVGGGVGMAWGTSGARIQLQYQVPKRAAPSCSATGTISWEESVGNFTQTSFSFDSPTQTHVLLYGIVSGTATVRSAMQAYVTNVNSFSVNFNAEL